MITTGNWQDALEPIAIKSFDVGFKKIPDELKMFYSVKKSEKLTETYLEIGDIGEMGEFTGTVDYTEIEQGFKMTITAREFAKGIKIQRKLAETDQIGVIEGLSEKLGLSVQRRISSDVMFPYNTGFTSATLTLDGLSLFNTAHTSNNGGSTQSNSGTTSFNAVAVEATRILMKKFLTNKDQRFSVMPDLLLVPQDLAEAAFELNTSAGKVNTANNNANFQKGKWTVVVCDWLTDSNNWFMIDTDLMKMFSKWNQVVNPEYNQARDFDGMVAKYLAYMFYGYGMTDWRFVYGQSVS